MMGRVLEKLGYETDSAENGPAGLQKLLGGHVDVVLVDHNMGEMDGLTFVKEARNIWPWMGMVLFSGYITQEVRQRAAEMGVEWILEKPVDIDLLDHAIQEESEMSRKRFHQEWTASPRNIHSQLAILRQLTNSALSLQSLSQALKDLALGLERLLPCSIIGVLVREDAHWLMLLHSNRPMPGSSLDKVRNEILSRYQALAGGSIPENNLRVEHEGAATESGSPDQVKHLISVPVIADHELAGVLCLGASGPTEVSGSDITFLYHAANQLATVLQALNHMRQQALLDPLTECYNRRYLGPELDRAWKRSRRDRAPLSLMVVDIDHFKEINDSLGHGRGDGVLVSFTRRLRTVIRDTDLIVRLGGDEFLLLLPGTRRLEAEELAQRLVQHFRTTSLEVDGQEQNLTISVGIAVCDDASVIASHHELLECADRALYNAKENGRDTHRTWSAEEADELTSIATPGVAPPPPAHAGRVLVVDDNKFITNVLRSFLEHERYEVEVATSVSEAVDTLKNRSADFDVLMTDLSLPGEDGFAMLKHAEQIDPHMVRVVVSGHVTAQNAITAMRHGAYDFVQKPFSREQLVGLMSRALEYRRLLNENQRYQKYLEEMVRAKSKEIAQNLGELKAAYDFSLEAMVAMLDAREYETSVHSRRVMELAEHLARAMGIREPELSQISRGALLHDIGKIAIPDRILQKPGPLDEDEMKAMRKHPEIGYNFIHSSPYLQTASDIVLCHHEAWDGSGYPRGLKAEEIPIGARIFTVVDSYDAMRAKRVYKAPMSRQQAVEEVRRQRGKQFDPQVVDGFMEILDEIEAAGSWTE